MGLEPTCSSGVGGCDFPIDPALAATETPVFWHPDDTPSVLWLTAAVDGDPSLLSAEYFSAPHAIEVDGAEGRYVFARSVGGCFRAVILPAGIGAPSLAVVLALDERLPERMAEIERHGAALGITVGAPPADPLSQFQRRRLGLMLRTFDARLVGASHHAIAELLFDADPMPAREWKSHSLRNQVRRAFADAMELVNGGYRRLLRPYRHRDRSSGVR
ncbi:DUF2285 domain-containing protein [Pinisolibacter aquiterrae]|uniref:DUF2285 domain-containing protein n=1 Tax=Pinisolibacter aquiterrae TaxID=2815579 RepID=UPI001C3C4076|nr:DUF2285 domain-containing protein [Pinisolibacter aquiterrae]MBV5262913.1 DUF2285 domain-containing protein [Pinisolibacter aquiterrae]MCC8235759.1 DUF2285 domain-containing protein [Pinisolibacter aquiterrae]